MTFYLAAIYRRQVQFKYKYKYLLFKYKYDYKYFKTVLEYNS